MTTDRFQSMHDLSKWSVSPFPPAHAWLPPDSQTQSMLPFSPRLRTPPSDPIAGISDSNLLPYDVCGQAFDRAQVRREGGAQAHPFHFSAFVDTHSHLILRGYLATGGEKARVPFPPPFSDVVHELEEAHCMQGCCTPRSAQWTLQNIIGKVADVVHERG